jgi:hypothetical protein
MTFQKNSELSMFLKMATNGIAIGSFLDLVVALCEITDS